MAMIFGTGVEYSISFLYSQLTVKFNNRATTTSHSVKYTIRITWGIIKTNILIPLGVLGQYTSHLLKCIRITWGTIKTKTPDNFLKGFFVIEGQFH